MRASPWPALPAISLIAAMAIPTASFADAVKPDSPLETLFRSSMYDMELARMATARGASPDVKRYADQVLRDQKTLNGKLSMLASQRNVTLACEPAAADKQVLIELRKKTGTDFDQEYTVHAARAEEKLQHMLVATDPKDTEFNQLSLTFKHLPEEHLRAVHGLRPQTIQASGS